jgi:hypothetical protein
VAGTSVVPQFEITPKALAGSSPGFDRSENHGLTIKAPYSRLEIVSTVRGSGWVAVPKCEIAIDYEYDRFTHPLPRTVLTVSK